MPIAPQKHLAAERAAERAQRDRDRGTSTERGYNAKWRKLRTWILRRDVVCRWPECEQLATCVDHILSQENGGDNELSNLAAMCKKHNSFKAVKYDRYNRKFDLVLKPSNCDDGF